MRMTLEDFGYIVFVALVFAALVLVFSMEDDECGGWRWWRALFFSFCRVARGFLARLKDLWRRTP